MANGITIGVTTGYRWTHFRDSIAVNSADLIEIKLAKHPINDDDKSNDKTER